MRLTLVTFVGSFFEFLIIKNREELACEMLPKCGGSECLFGMQDVTDLVMADGTRLAICQQFEVHFGSFCWPSSMLLAEWLCENKQDLVVGKRIFELGGGGTGIPSLYCAKAGASRVHWHDQVENMELMQRQVQLNLSLPKEKDVIRLVHFNWRQ